MTGFILTSGSLETEAECSSIYCPDVVMVDAQTLMTSADKRSTKKLCYKFVTVYSYLCAMQK